MAAPGMRGGGGMGTAELRSGSQAWRPALRAGMQARRPALRIDRLQGFYDVVGAALVAFARALAGDVEIGAEPAFEGDALEDTVAGGEVDFAVAEIEDLVGDLAGDAFGGFVVKEPQEIGRA